MACANPIAINNGTVNNFGFTTVFNPYAKTVKFETSGLSTFVDDYGVLAVFKITDPTGNVIGDLAYDDSIPDNTIDIANESSVTVALTSGGILFFGTYTIEGRIYSDINTYNDISFDVEVCYDGRLENSNYIKGCITVDTNCSTAKMSIKEQTNFKYNGLTPVSKTYVGKLTYPDNYIAQKTFTYVPYAVSLNGSITGLYQVSVTSVGRYELETCKCYVDTTFISKWAEEVNCAGALSTLLCCWTQSLEIANRGGTLGAQMREKLDEAEPIFNMALLQELSGKNSEVAVKELQKLLGCDCKCQKGLTIQSNPITLNGKNVVGACGVTATEDDDSITLSTYIIELGACEETSGFSFNKTVDSCTQTWCLTVDYDVVQQQVLNAIAADSDNITNWKNVLGIDTGCPCKTNVVWLSQNGLPPASDNPLVFSQVTVCGGNVVSFTPQVADSIQDIVTYLNANATINDYGVFALSADGTGIVSSYVPTTGACVVMVYLYQSCATTVIVNGAPLIMDVNRLATYYTVLSNTYFTKSDTIVSIDLKDQTTITNGSLGTITITESITSGTDSISTLGEEYTLAVDECGSELIGNTGVITQVTNTSLGCTQTTNCNTSFERVAYSERWTDAYRWNPQINDLPYYGDYIIINNSDQRGNSVIRVYNTVTNEAWQIAGNIGLSKTPTTLNDVWGDVVEYHYASSVYVDKSAISNGMPTLYFCTYGSVFCKLVRERTDQCDERANWKNYVLAGTNGGLIAANPATGTAAGLYFPFGAKRLGTVNGQPSFVIYNSGQARLDFLYYKLTPNNVNASANWYVETLAVTAPGIGGNINIDREESYTDAEDVVHTNILVLYVFGETTTNSFIKKYYYIGSETSATDIINGGNYEEVIIINQTSDSVDGLASTVGRIKQPNSLSKITYNNNTTYVFSESYTGSIPIGKQKLRGFYQSDPATAAPAGFTILTLVPDNNKAYSTFGFATSGSGTPTANGTTNGIFWHPTKSVYYEMAILGGLRTFCVNQDVTQATIRYINVSGAASALATEQDLTQIVDTNYELIIDCGE